MKVTECFWEIQNIGKKTVEIGVEKEDKFLEADINEASSGYQYVVVKVPMDKVDFNVGLSNMGFSMIEVQMNILKKSKDFDYDSPFIKEIYNDMYLNVSKKLSKVNPNTLSERYLQEIKKVLEKEIKASNKQVKEVIKDNIEKSIFCTYQ